MKGIETIENLTLHLNEYSKLQQSKDIELSRKDYFRGVEVATTTILVAISKEKKIGALEAQIKGDNNESTF